MKRWQDHFDKRWQKAKQLLGEGRVVLRYSAPSFFLFHVKGETDDHEVIYNKGKWMCDCEWNSLHPDNPCSHILASWLWLKRNVGIEVVINGLKQNRKER